MSPLSLLRHGIWLPLLRSSWRQVSSVTVPTMECMCEGAGCSNCQLLIPAGNWPGWGGDAASALYPTGAAVLPEINSFMSASDSQQSNFDEFEQKLFASTSTDHIFQAAPPQQLYWYPQSEYISPPQFEPYYTQTPFVPSASCVPYSPPSNNSPPPQDPLVTPRPAAKKRIPAVSCHSNSVCANCETRDTSLWRRNNAGDIECNACNLYFRKNNRKRPIALRKGVIMKRNRKPRANETANHR